MIFSLKLAISIPITNISSLALRLFLIVFASISKGIVSVTSLQSSFAVKTVSLTLSAASVTFPGTYLAETISFFAIATTSLAGLFVSFTAFTVALKQQLLLKNHQAFSWGCLRIVSVYSYKKYVDILVFNLFGVFSLK